jgi:hypothetical protein
VTPNRKRPAAAEEIQAQAKREKVFADFQPRRVGTYS